MIVSFCVCFVQRSLRRFLKQNFSFYCWDIVDDSFDEASEALEFIFRRFMEYEEKLIFRESDRPTLLVTLV